MLKEYAGVVQKQGAIGWKDTDKRVEPGSGDLQKRGIIGGLPEEMRLAASPRASPIPSWRQMTAKVIAGTGCSGRRSIPLLSA
jgi:hypothetical protein